MKWAPRYFTFQFQKRILKREMSMRLPTGSKLILPLDHSASNIYITKANIDWGAEALLSKFADPYRDFLDIGANIGYYSNYLSPLVKNVYAFEPDPRNLPALMRNAATRDNIIVSQVAISSKDGNAKLAITKGSTTNTLEPLKGVETIDVKLSSIDSFVARTPSIDVALIKTDIEGHDLQALFGMEETVKVFQPLILSEIVIDQRLLDLARRWKYRLFAFVCNKSTFEISLKQFSLNEIPEDWYNMVFLVPPRLVDFGQS